MNHTLTCAIIDDNPESIAYMVAYVEKFTNLSLLFTETDPLIAQRRLFESPVDLVLVDIEMPVLNGLELARSLPASQKLIFFTGYQEYAMESFELDAVDYLLKPVPFDRFAKAIKKVMHFMRMERFYHKNNIENDYIYLRDVNRKILEHVLLEDIMYIETQGNYLMVHLLNKTLHIRKRLNELLVDLPTDRFRQIHKSYVVARKMIDSGNSAHIYLKGKAEPIPVGKKYRRQI